jgi:electron transfer flavoprotein alpha subunit
MSSQAENTEVWVLGETRATGELTPAVFELSSKARELANTLSSSGRVTVVLTLDAQVAHKAAPEKLGLYGADRVLIAKGKYLPFDRAACARILARLAKSERPEIIVAPATAFGRAVMPYAAALLGTGLTADCTGLSIEIPTQEGQGKNGFLLQTRPAIGGNVMATIKTPAHRPQMATVRPRGVPPDPGPDRHPVTLELPEERETVRTVKFAPFSQDEGTVKDKEVVVSGGKGLRRPEGFGLLSKLAALLDAGVGASRPVVEMKWIGYPHQVGLSGHIVSPKVYFALGISGSVQHLAGMQTAGKIISVNKDPEAQIFNVSDVALWGDLYEVLPKLIDKIEKIKTKGSRS